MSRIGKNPIIIPEGVTVSIDESVITVKGKLGELSQEFSEVSFKIEDSIITVERSSENKNVRAKHGLYRSLVHNMIKGVTDGFEKKLELQGVGYRGQVQGKSLVLNVGYSHQITIPAPEGINLAVEANTKVTVNGIDKQLVGQVAANIRATRPPEPYKGKGVRYEGEYVRKKAGKTGK